MSRESWSLVLGASGFLGSHLVASLLRAGRKVRAFDQHWTISQWAPFFESGLLEVCEASVFDEDALHRSLQGVDTVFNFLSFSVPSTLPEFLHNELRTTLQAMDLVLTSMVATGAQTIFFPSSGGSIYGETGGRQTRETDPLKPLSSYGMGKLLCEEMIRFYGRVHGLRYMIVRPSNVYGAPCLRRSSQGVIDVFLEEIREGQPLTVWGNPDNIRDYIFIDDFIGAVLRLLDLDDKDSRVLNIGTGKGVSVREIVSLIRRIVGSESEERLDPTKFSGISYNVLDISLLCNLTGWQPCYSIDEGITEAWRRKQITGPDAKGN